MAERFKIAVAPDTQLAMYDAMVQAVVDAGGEVVPVAEASGLMWADPAAADEFPAVATEGTELEWVQLPFAGIETFATALDPALIWTCGKGVYADPVAEHVIALILAGFRHLHEAIPAKTWPAKRGQNLLGANIAVVGAGGITDSLFGLLQPWGTQLSVVRRSNTPFPGATRTVAQSDAAAVHDVIAQADAVVIAAALTDETADMVDAAFLAAMKPTAWLINVARGGLVDHDALLAAFDAGSIGGAALDVTTPEPLPVGHRLWDMENCIITPHVGNTPEMGLPLIAARVKDNTSRWIAGEDLIGLVDVEAGY